MTSSIFTSILLLCGVTYYSSFQLLENAFFATCLLIGNISFLMHGSDGKRPIWNFDAFLLFQCLCFGGMSIELSSLAPLYLCFVPSSVSVVFARKRKIKQGVSLLAISLLAYTAMALVLSSPSNQTSFFLHGLSFISIAFWGWSLLSSGLVHSLKARVKRHNERVQKNKHFYNDLVNQLYTLNSFINEKMSVDDKHLGRQEMVFLYYQMKSLNSVVKDHFKTPHRNLVNTYDYLGRDKIEIETKRMVDFFLPETKVHRELSFIGDDDKTQGFYYPGFMRALTLVLKGMADRQTSKMSLQLSFSPEGLNFETKERSFSNLNRRSFDLSSKLEELILNERSLLEEMRQEHIQEELDAFAFLAECFEGSFEYEFCGDELIVKFFLPANTQNERLITQKGVLKRAA